MAREGNKLEQTKFGKITFSLQYINFSNIWSRFGAENIRSFLATVCGKVCSSNCLNLIFALTIQWELMKKTSAWFAMNQMPLVHCKKRMVKGLSITGSHNSAQNGMERWYQNWNVFTLLVIKPFASHFFKHL